MSVKEFRSLAGGITTWAPSIMTRRYSLEWGAMAPGDVAHIDALARRISYTGPLVVLDPLAVNLFSGRQAEGKGDFRQWDYSASEVTMYAVNAAPSSVVANVTTAPTGGAAIGWKHPTWAGFPVPGGAVTWWPWSLATSNAAKISGLDLKWYSASGSLLSTSTQTDATKPMVATAPASAAFVAPSLRLTATGFYTLGRSALCLGDAAAYLTSLGSSLPMGEGSPGVSITGYRHAATPGDGAYRDIGLDLVEVTSATG
ncbi:hypothetical protein ACFQ67_05480 [Streptomyces sp. NPDC056488]|uniref:hypothetical protein n=1 Tax=Streptomyces sp. NPDC056488 TaxID=3345836 RepID=UPI00368C4213